MVYKKVVLSLALKFNNCFICEFGDIYINRNSRPNNHQLITFYQCLRYLLRIQQFPANNSLVTGLTAPKAPHTI